MYFPEPLSKPESAWDTSEYRYTKEELEYLDRIEDEEEIRGANIRFWEDVSIGEETQPVVLGPITILDIVGCTPRGNFEETRIRRVYQQMPQEFIHDPVTGIYHHGIEAHMSDRVAELMGDGRAIIYARQARYLMIRLVTNWMGDDGFLRKFNYRSMAHAPIGDTLIGRGRVTNKRVENGEYLVDLKVWLDNMRGNIHKAAVATVSLFSKEAPYPWK
jgi:hypothetical protein